MPFSNAYKCSWDISDVVGQRDVKSELKCVERERVRSRARDIFTIFG